MQPEVIETKQLSTEHRLPHYFTKECYERLKHLIPELNLSPRGRVVSSETQSPKIPRASFFSTLNDFDKHTRFLDRKVTLGQTQKFFCRAIDQENLKIINTLLDRGYDIDQKDGKGMTVLHYAAQIGVGNYPKRKAIIRKLLEYGGDITLQDNQGKTAIHYATEKSYNRAFVKCIINFFNCLKKFSKQIFINTDEMDASKVKCITAKIEAIQTTYELVGLCLCEVIRYRLNPELNDQKDHKTLNRVTNTLINGLVSRLIKSCLSEEDVFDKIFNLTDLFINFRYIEIPDARLIDNDRHNKLQSKIKKLIQQIGDIILERVNETIINIFESDDYSCIYELYEDEETFNECNTDTVASGYFSYIQENVDQDEISVLLIPLKESETEQIYKKLIEDLGFFFNERLGELFPSQFQVQNKNKSEIKLKKEFFKQFRYSSHLINSLCDRSSNYCKTFIDTQDDQGRGILHNLAENGSPAEIQWFLGQGADVNIKDKEGNTPFDYAVARKSIKIVKCFLRNANLSYETLSQYWSIPDDGDAQKIKIKALLEAKMETIQPLT